MALRQVLETDSKNRNTPLNALLVRLVMDPQHAEFDNLFAKTVLDRGLVSAAQMQECLLLKKQEEKSGRQYNIGQILIKRRYITCADFLTIQNSLERKLYQCSVCKTRYRARELSSEKLTCRGCGQVVAVSGAGRFSQVEILLSNDPSNLIIPLLPADQVPVAAPVPAPVLNGSKNGKAKVWGGPPKRVDKVALEKTEPVADKKPEAAKDKGAAKNKGRYRPALDFDPGQLNALDRFEIVEELGRGGMGVVFKARQSDNGRIVALKVITSSPQVSQAQINRFVQEGRSAAHLHHPNIIRIYDCGKYKNFFYIAMEFLEGQALNDFMKNSSPDLDLILDIFDDLLAAAHYAHENQVIHRDLKPQNIMIEHAGHRAKLIDFGLAKDFEEGMELTVPGQILGSPFYLSPEQTRGESYKVDRRSDVFALGVILYELTTGKRPFTGKSAAEVYAQILKARPTPPMALSGDVDEELQDIILTALEKDVEDRFQSAQEMREALKQYREDDAELLERLKKSSRRSSKKSKSKDKAKDKSKDKSKDKAEESKTRRRSRSIQKDKTEVFRTKSGSMRLKSQRNTTRSRRMSTARMRGISVQGNSGGTSDRKRSREFRGDRHKQSDSTLLIVLGLLLLLGAGSLFIFLGPKKGTEVSQNDPDQDPDKDPKKDPDKDPDKDPQDKPDKDPDRDPLNNPDGPDKDPDKPEPKDRDSRAKAALARIQDAYQGAQPDYGDALFRLKDFFKHHGQSEHREAAKDLERRVNKEASKAFDDTQKKAEALLAAKDIKGAKGAEALLKELQGRMIDTRWQPLIEGIRGRVQKNKREFLGKAIEDAEGLVKDQRLAEAREVLSGLTPTGEADLDQKIASLLARIEELEGSKKDPKDKPKKDPKDPEPADIPVQDIQQALVDARQAIGKRAYKDASKALEPHLKLTIPGALGERFAAMKHELEMLTAFLDVILKIGPHAKDKRFAIGALSGKIIEVKGNKLVLKSTLGGTMSQDVMALKTLEMGRLFGFWPKAESGPGLLMLGVFYLAEGDKQAAKKALSSATKLGVPKAEDYLALAQGSKTKGTQSTDKTPAASKDDLTAVKNDEAWVRIPAGKFLMGTRRGDADAVPEREVTVDNFYMGKYEVTNRRYRRFLADIKKQKNPHKRCHPNEPPDKDHSPVFWGNDKFQKFFRDGQPVVGVDWYDAYAFANHHRFRLPTEAEWEKAARGNEGRRFPWGDDWDAKRCVSIPYWIDKEGSSSSIFDEFMAFFQTAPKITLKVDKMPKGQSFFKLHHMAGNAAEWCMDFYDKDQYVNDYNSRNNSNPEGPSTGTKRVARGCGFVGQRRQDYYLWKRIPLKPTTRKLWLGFRVIRPTRRYKN